MSDPMLANFRCKEVDTSSHNSADYDAVSGAAGQNPQNSLRLFPANLLGGKIHGCGTDAGHAGHHGHGANAQNQL